MKGLDGSNPFLSGEQATANRFLQSDERTRPQLRRSGSDPGGPEKPELQPFSGWKCEFSPSADDSVPFRRRFARRNRSSDAEDRAAEERAQHPRHGLRPKT